MKLLILPLVLLGLTILAGQHGVMGKPNYRTEKQILSHFIKYVTRRQTTEEMQEFKKIIEILAFPQYIYRKPVSSYSNGRVQLSCVTCRSTVKTLLEMHKQGSTGEELTELIVDMCILLELQTPKVCRGVVELNAPIILYIIENQPLFKADTFCGVLLQSNDKNSCPYNDDRFDWKIDLPEKNSTNEPPSLGNSSFKIVQISDLHYDPIYESGGLAECNEPTCCRRGQTEQASPRWRSLYNDESSEQRISRDENGGFLLDIDYVFEVREQKALNDKKEKRKGKPKSSRAGYWGDYRDCDTPWWAIQDALNSIRDTHKDMDIIYYTGDTIDHGVWETTQEGNTESLQDTYNLIKNTFRRKPVYPSIGNHESQPLNQYAPVFITDPKLSTSWLYDLLVEEWSSWLPAETKETIKMGGYYTALVRPGFRVVVLNSNLCYVYNWWLHMEPNDPNGQFKWLVDVLTQAEADGEIVHILSHIPTGISDYLSTCSREYKRIVERFSDTIAAEFNGHTHNDEFKVFYAKEDINKPVAVAWNGGSVTAYSDVNPNYRVYNVDDNNYDVVDIETWVYNLTEANLSPNKRPEWFKLYSFKEHYGLSSLSLDSIDDLFQRMVTTQKELLAEDYHIFRGKNSDHYINKPCTSTCIKKSLRYLTGTELYDNRKSEALWATLQGSNSTKN